MRNISLQKTSVWVGITAFILTFWLATFGCFAQSTWTNVGSILQMKVIGTDTLYRFPKSNTSMYGAPFAASSELAKKLNLSDSVTKYITPRLLNEVLATKANLTGGNNFIGNQTISGNLHLPFNRWFGYNNTSPLAPVHIGNRNVLNSSNAQILIAGTYDDSFVSSGHAFSDGTLINGVGSGKAYAGYDGRVDIQGLSVDMDHYVSFQHGPNLNFTGTLKDNFGYYSTSLIQSGAITNNYGTYLSNPIKTGGTLVNNYGLYIANQLSGTNNWSIYSAGGFNYFGGSMQIDGTQSLNSTGQNLRLKADGTSGKDGGVYVNIIGDIFTSNWEGTRGFVSLGNGNGYYFGGNFGVKTATPLEALDVSGKARVSMAPTNPTDVLRLEDIINYTFINSSGTAPTPTSLGKKGEIRYDGAYRYECKDTNTWVRFSVELTW